MAYIKIIAGNLKGRKLKVISEKDLRPTKSSQRETLFNWLNFYSYENVLDLFAGSGSLGFEAISRGAKNLVLCEKNKKVAANLEDFKKIISDKKITIYPIDAFDYLKKKDIKVKFDLVFLDPPFAKNYLVKILDNILKADILAKKALIYIERPTNYDFVAIKNLEIIKEKKTKNIIFGLYRFVD